MTKHYEFNENDSFAIQPGYIARIHQRGKFMGTFSFIYHHAIQEAVLRTKDSFKTLGYLMGSITLENIIYTDIPTLAIKLNISKVSIQRHLHILRDEGLLIPHEDERLNARSISRYRICPFLGWKGTAKALEKYLSTLPISHPFWEYADPEFVSTLKEEIQKEKYQQNISL